MWLKLVLDISELSIPLEDFMKELVENGFVIHEHIEEKAELIVKRYIPYTDYLKMNLYYIKEVIKGKFEQLKVRLCFEYIVLKEKLLIIKDKIKSGISKLRGKVSRLFKRGE